MSPSRKNSTETPDFERALGELEETVRRLEAGDLPLEESLSAFEKGIALVRTLHARLDAVQMRIDELTKGPDGSASLTPFTAPAGRAGVAGRSSAAESGSDDAELAAELADELGEDLDDDEDADG